MREEMPVRSMAKHGKAYNAVHRGIFSRHGAERHADAGSIRRCTKSVGISRLRGLIASQASPEYRDRAVFMTEPLLRFCYEAGFIRGAVSAGSCERRARCPTTSSPS